MPKHEGNFHHSTVISVAHDSQETARASYAVTQEQHKGHEDMTRLRN